MITLEVELGTRSYPILIGSGLLARPAVLEPFVHGRQVMIVTNEVVGAIYLAPLQRLLAGCRTDAIVLPDGEACKTLAQAGLIVDRLVAGRYGRDCVVVTLGGGVIGDLGGFAAAIYQRGVAFIQVPTTLLAQVDSSVGGKTGVNHPGGKNLIGAFHQPHCVLADTDTLRTLPDRELSAGLAEVVKYGVIADAELFSWIEGQADALLRREPAALLHAIRRSCEIKAAIVAADEREQGVRALLNLGHTFGHAIEVCAGYGEWLHGEAVAAGTCLAAELAARLGRLDPRDVDRIRRLLGRLRLPTAPPAIEPKAFLAAMAMDKKVLGGRIRLVLPTAIGAAQVTADYAASALEELVEEQLASAP